ncbi:Hypothetical protein, putative, partial [Bodo saltans]
VVMKTMLDRVVKLLPYGRDASTFMRQQRYISAVQTVDQYRALVSTSSSSEISSSGSSSVWQGLGASLSPSSGAAALDIRGMHQLDRFVQQQASMMPTTIIDDLLGCVFRRGRFSATSSAHSNVMEQLVQRNATVVSSMGSLEALLNSNIVGGGTTSNNHQGAAAGGTAAQTSVLHISFTGFARSRV